MLKAATVAALCLSLPICCRAELPNAPQQHDAQQGQQEIDNTSAQSLVRGADGKIHLARWSVSIFAFHDAKGWGPSSRIDYRINNRWGIVTSEVKSSVSTGFTLRLGSLK